MLFAKRILRESKHNDETVLVLELPHIPFEHLHKAERLPDIKKDFPKCKTCNVEASWWRDKKYEIYHWLLL